MTRTWLIAASLGSAALLAAACGGTVVFEEDGGRGTGDGGAGDGGNGNGSTSSRTASATSTAVDSASSGFPVSQASAATAGGSSPDSVAVSVSSGPSGCTTHEDCGDGNLCIFATGECARACAADACDSCGEGFVCDSCASSSCPKCADCRAACIPTAPGRCDDDDRCPDGQACNFFTGFCDEACGPDGTCATPGKFCDSCATSSCCACDSCSGLCIFGDD